MSRTREYDLTRPVEAKDHIRGAASAIVTLVEYGDYECPHCGVAHETVNLLMKRFGGELRFVYRNFPLVEIHQHAESAAIAAEAAGALGHFWAMHDLLFVNQQHLRAANLARYAIKAGCDEQEFLTEFANDSPRRRVREDFQSGVDSGVHGTPTFFINGIRHDGSRDFETLALAIEEAIHATR